MQPEQDHAEQDHAEQDHAEQDHAEQDHAEQDPTEAAPVPPTDAAVKTAPKSALWHGDTERLDRVLPELDLARSRSQAAELIHEGKVSLDGTIAPKPGVKVNAGSRIEVLLSDHYVGRAAHKLIAGLDAFAIDPKNQQALDLGASTGGFTQVLLERGASLVQAIDVGHGQLAAELRTDPRVHLVEGCNARDLTAESLSADTGIATPPSLVVADLSFISLSLILPAIARVAAADSDVILLVKPQFEVGRVRDGVVTDPRLHAEALRIVVGSAAEHGFVTRALIPSPVTGGQGNREFLAHFTHGEAADPAEWEDRIEALSRSSEKNQTSKNRADS